MFGWLGDWGSWLAWSVLLVGGWWSWFKAHQRAERLDAELTRLAYALRFRRPDS